MRNEVHINCVTDDPSGPAAPWAGGSCIGAESDRHEPVLPIA